MVYMHLQYIIMAKSID